MYYMSLESPFYALFISMVCFAETCPVSKMEAKTAKTLNLSHAGLCAKAISITLNMPIATVYCVIKSGTIKRKTNTSPGNIKATPEFLQQLRQTMKLKPTESIRNIAKKMNVHERTIRRSLKLIQKKSVVCPPRQLLTERQKQLCLELGHQLINKLKSLPLSTVSS
jgi:hypothetical protein